MMPPRRPSAGSLAAVFVFVFALLALILLARDHNQPRDVPGSIVDLTTRER